MVKVSDFVAEFLAQEGIRHVFAVSGGASLHLIHSIAETPGITFVCPQHEQAGAMAADAYARVTGNLGAAIATSGPGATNMLTGVCCAYYDSVPTLFLTGQVSTTRLKGTSGVRQIGFQETDTVEIFRSVTKYAVMVTDATRIRYELEKAVHIARSGRPGPVLVDIPDDIQRCIVDRTRLESFTPEEKVTHPRLHDHDLDRCVALLREAERPVVILGWGVRLAGAERAALEFVERLGFPVLPTWATRDLLPSAHPLVVGSFGTHGTRYANFAVQNADVVVAIGSRLDTREAGSPLSTFARGARKIVVDIDPHELAKFALFGLPVDVPINADAREFLTRVNERLADERMRPVGDWLARISEWKHRYPVCLSSYAAQEPVNPYVFVNRLSAALEPGATIFTDTGCAVAWLMQAFDVKEGQRLFHDFNNTAMGYALPASIGACFALDRKPVVCVTGDGSLQMNLQELATVLRHELPIKIFLINNHGHSMIQQTQDQWLGSRYLASSVEGGLAFPDFTAVARAYGFPTETVEKNHELDTAIRKAVESPGPFFCNVEVSASHRVVPQVKFGRPIEDAEPLLPRAEFLANMIVPPLDVSRHGAQ